MWGKLELVFLTWGMRRVLLRKLREDGRFDYDYR